MPYVTPNIHFHYGGVVNSPKLELVSFVYLYTVFCSNGGQILKSIAWYFTVEHYTNASYTNELD